MPLSVVYRYFRNLWVYSYCLTVITSCSGVAASSIQSSALPAPAEGAVLSTAFLATRLTASTFLIKEYDDIYDERPHIYAKIVPSANAILIIDTGCGGKTKNATVQVTSLRTFIEMVPVEGNRNNPLNVDGKMDYVVVTTHCHYDHICRPTLPLFCGLILTYINLVAVEQLYVTGARTREDI